ncbi:MAG: hypothetical protein J5711_04595 [Bacteroidales bacterium]|nr:hypothetical protein [Bacteroidales bacterium]
MDIKNYHNIVLVSVIGLVACSSIHKTHSNLKMFYPNENITISEVEDMGGERENGIDIDVYVFQRQDTTIVLEFDVDSTFIGIQWMVPVPDSPISDSIFLNQICNSYNVVFSPSGSTLYCKGNGLTYDYYIGPVDIYDYNIKSKRYFKVIYRPAHANQ